VAAVAVYFGYVGAGSEQAIIEAKRWLNIPLSRRIAKAAVHTFKANTSPEQFKPQAIWAYLIFKPGTLQEKNGVLLRIRKPRRLLTQEMLRTSACNIKNGRSERRKDKFGPVVGASIPETSVMATLSRASNSDDRSAQARSLPANATFCNRLVTAAPLIRKSSGIRLQLNHKCTANILPA
jgi:hypothetical protein